MVIERHDESGKLAQVFYNLNKLGPDQLRQIPLKNRDSVKVIASEVNIYILGAVNKAGAFEYKLNSTPLDYLAQAEGSTPEAHLRFAVIIRPPRDPNAPLEASQLIPCDLLQPLRAEGPAGPTIQPGDILFIPTRGHRATLDTIFTALSVLINTIRLFQ
jgi:polysaccharide export outer membrane protein